MVSPFPAALAVRSPDRKQLKFGRGNAKLDNAIFTFSLPAGHTCPFAEQCLSKADKKTGRIKDGRHTEFRCYAATMETRPSVRRSRWHNFQQLRACKTQAEVTQLILDSLSPFAGYVRVHDSGDFYSQAYFDAWMDVARQRPETWFYAYTKSLPYWVARMGTIPDNLVLTASYGGTRDDLIDRHGLRYAIVVYSRGAAEELGLPIDHDDSHAMRSEGNFALLLHGTQPEGSDAARSLAALKAEGWYGYSARGAAGPRRVSLPLA